MPPTNFGADFPSNRFRRALDAMGDVALVRLQKKADAISVVLGGSVGGNDLLHDAVLRTLAGKRSFPDDVNLEAYLVMTMKSIASGEMEKRVCASNGRRDAAVALHNSPAADNVLVDLALLMDKFEQEGEDVAALVIEEWRHGRNGPEAKASLGIDETTYNSAVRCIRRKAPRFLPGRKARKS